MAKIAAIQLCSTEIIDENLRTVADMVQKAAAQNARLVVLPEMFACLKSARQIETTSASEYPGSGKIQDFLANLAVRHNIWIVGGTLPLVCEKTNKIKAACLVFDNFGVQVARYDKIHLFDVQLSPEESYKESASIEPGDTLSVIDTPLGKLGLCVCFDIRFPQMFSELVALGAEIIAIPAAFTQKTGEAHWELLMRCRALDSFCYIVGAGQGGNHPNGRATYGHSMIVSPWGDIIDEVLTPSPAIAFADIDLQKLYDIRAKIPVIPLTTPSQPKPT